jgi:AraC family transcriptional regulator
MPKDQNLLRALDYIDSNITRDICLYDISKEAGFSVPHFYRLFKRLTGDTVGEYILRRKMAMAANDLAAGNKTVCSIALEYGFESHDVFTRAFKRVYGVPPNKYRYSNRPPPIKRLTLINNDWNANEQQMNFKLLHVESFYVIGMECNAKKWDSDGAVGRLWSDFLPHIDERRQLAGPMVMYGICEHDSCNNNQFRYMAAIGVDSSDEAASDMSVRRIRSQTFLQACVPEAVSIPDAYSGTIGYAKSLGYEVEEYDYIEVYEESFQNPDVNSFKLLIPIK